jgi:predicted secreted protein
MDERGKKIVIVAHCLLNQNTRVWGIAKNAKITEPLIKALIERNMGIYQLPCPEFVHLGLRRFWCVKEQLDTPAYRRLCKTIAIQVNNDVVTYAKDGYKILAIIGVKGSPTCAITEIPSGTWQGPPFKVERSCRKAGKGILIEEMEKLLDSSIRFLEFDFKDVTNSILYIKDQLNALLNQSHERDQ